MKNFKQILSLISEAKLEPGGEDAGKLFGPKGKFSPKSKDAPKEPTFNARMKSGNLTPNPDTQSGMEELLRRNPPEEGQKEPTAHQRMVSGEIDYRLMPSAPAPSNDKKPKENKKPPSRTKKPSAAKRPTGSFPVVTNNLHHDQVTMKRLSKGDANEIRTTIREYTPGFLQHSDALTAHLRGFQDYAGIGASDYEKALYAHNIISNHLNHVSFKIASIHKGLPIQKKFGKAKLSHFTQDNSWPGERTLKLHFHPLKTYVSGASELKELTDHLEKHTGHAWYIHPDSGTQMVGTKNSPLILATSINHPWLRGEDEGGGDDGNEPETPKPRNPKGKQPTGPKAPTRPRMPSLV
jgi:hypothetical protein